MKNISLIYDSEIPEDEIFDSIIINTHFELNDLHDDSIISKESNYIQTTSYLIKKASKLLKNGGILFVYGLPKYLPFFAVNLNDSAIDNHRFLFKYWIGLEFNSSEEFQGLKNNHIGMLMYLKTKSLESPTPFNLNTKEVRVSHKYCAACGMNIKDWGGKKHLMNPLGTALSDVWSDLTSDLSDATTIPEEVIKRIYGLIKENNSKLLIIKQRKNVAEHGVNSIQIIENKYNTLPDSEINKVIFGDCFEYMQIIKNRFPDGVFDLAFADPPYNLFKSYTRYEDAQEDMAYIEWCNKWLHGMVDILKPGGALLILNIPKWAVYHAVFLLNKMNFQHWIVWDALSTPAGKLLPAHYALLYFTKPGGKIKNNYEKLKYLDSRKYCLRSSCIRKRKFQGDDDKEKMSDVWKDIHRIKHKRDRDYHPCQLPLKLMNRIIELFTNEGDVVYDPFGGAGTTAISAKLLNRSFILSEIDPEYVELSKRNLNKIVVDETGKLDYIRESAKQKNNGNGVAKKSVEMSYLQLCSKYDRILDKDDIKLFDNTLYDNLGKYTGNFRKLQNVCKRKFETEKLIK